MKSEFHTLLEKEIESRLNSLRTRSYNELADFKELVSDRIMINKKPVIISTWKDITKDNKLRVVVQAYRPVILGFGFMRANGFLIDEHNNVKDLKRDELYEFV